VTSQRWGKEPGDLAWIKVANAQQSVKYARQLLKNIQLSEETMSSSSSIASGSTFPAMEQTLDRLEPELQEISKKFTPPNKPRKSLLAALPKLTRPPPPPTLISDSQVEQSIRHVEQDTSASNGPTTDLLLTPSEEPSLPPSRPSITPATSSNTDKPQKSSSSAFLATSLQTQEELSLQLAQMATQLKLNAVHFTESLAKDRAVMEGAEEKLEGNLTRLKTERSRLRIYSGKSGSTTWLVLGAIVVVVGAWVLMFLVIRIT